MANGYKITTQDVLQRCDIRAAKTLTRWRKAGILPTPLIETHPSGKGKTAYYPVWICDWINWVRYRLANGESLDGIAKTINVDWTASDNEIIEALNRKNAFRSKISDLWDLRETSFFAFKRKMFATLCSGRVYRYLQRLGIQRPGIAHALEDAFASPDLFEKALKHLKSTPILMILDGSIDIVPCSSVLSELSRSKFQGVPMLVMPVHDLVLMAGGSTKQFEKGLAGEYSKKLEKARKSSSKRSKKRKK
jgi:hypothetical protein